MTSFWCVHRLIGFVFQGRRADRRAGTPSLRYVVRVMTSRPVRVKRVPEHVGSVRPVRVCAELTKANDCFSGDLRWVARFGLK